MSDYNFIRFFVILNENNKSYGTVAAPNGYCKVEGLNGNAVFTVSVRNLKRTDGQYRLYVLLKGSDVPTYVGELVPSDDGMVYKNYQTRAENLFGSGFEISSLEAMYILAENNESVLCGYINRNITKQAKQISEAKLSNINKKEEAPQTFQAAGISSDDGQLEGSFPTELETTKDSDELDEAEAVQDNDAANADDNVETASADEEPHENSGGSELSSYVKTLTRLYEGIVKAGGERGEKKSDEPRECGYWSRVKTIYDGLFESESNNDVPFDFFKSNSKWISISPYSDNTAYLQLIGLIYENGGVKYIVNGIPVFANMLCMPCPSPCMLWLPAKQNSRGIMGYWLTFIDADTGKQTEPDICVL